MMRARKAKMMTCKNCKKEVNPICYKCGKPLHDALLDEAVEVIKKCNETIIYLENFIKHRALLAQDECNASYGTTKDFLARAKESGIS